MASGWRAAVFGHIGDAASRPLSRELPIVPLPHHARLISFALYDAHPKYTLNAVINCLLAIEVYPGWTCRFYVDGTVPQGIRHTLRAFSHVEVVDMLPTAALKRDCGGFYQPPRPSSTR